MASDGPYTHRAHAGNHADVFKHLVFTAVIKEIQKEHPEGIFLVDTHAGYGYYDLTEQESLEWKKGIQKVLKVYSGPQPYTIPDAVKDYIRLLLEVSDSKGVEDFEWYPGSPILGQRLLRKKDEHRLADLYVEREEIEGLDSQADFEQADAYDPSMMDYILPDTDKHCVILIDPPYDGNHDDFYQAKQLVQRLLERNPFATVMLWIPYLHGSRHRWSYPKGMKELAKEKALRGRYFASLSVAKDGLMGSAMMVCNPTKEFDDIISDQVLEWLANTMSQGKLDFLTEQIMKRKKQAPVEEEDA